MIRTRGKLVQYGEVWFDETPDPPTPDIMIYRQRLAPLPHAKCSPFLSLVTDLSVEERFLWERLDKSCRYDIRRAEKDGVTCTHELNPSAATIAEFESFFAEFAAQRALQRLDTHWLSAAVAAGRLFLGSARFEGKAVVWHSHVVAGSVVRLLHSCSLRHDSESRRNQLVGRANRLLHWTDLREFRRLGLRIHDWGGLFAEESDLAKKKINDFKREFGGEERHYYDCTISLTALGRMYLPIRSAWRKALAGFPGSGMGSLRIAQGE
jgi:hypothetical protein